MQALKSGKKKLRKWFVKQKPTDSFVSWLHVVTLRVQFPSCYKFV